MHAVIAVVVGLMVSTPLVAESLVEGWVRRSSGEPVAAAQVRVFDWTDLPRGAVAQATTDATGYFALPLKSLGGSVLPQTWTLGQNYPNPFNPSTLIPYQVPTAGRVRLEVFNVLGQRVATLVDEARPAGAHTAVWDATDAAGRAVGAGVYFYRLRSAGHPTLTRRMVLVDGQAGQAASVALPQAQETAPAAEGLYGLSVTGAGLVTYVDASFGVWSGMAAVEVVVDAVARLPRGKALTDRVLGDVNGDGQVTLDDALLVMTYVVNGSVALPANGDISLGDVNGDGQVTLDDALLVMTYVVNPADGSLPSGIGQAVSSSGGAWVAGAIRRLTTDSGWSPSWSPDGRHIAFVSERDGNGEIYVMGSDGSNPRRLTNNLVGDWSPSWSPDGRHIAFESNRDGNGEIYVMGSDGSNPRRLTNNLVGDWSPSWSPDGRHIAFESNRDGNGEIYVMGSDGSNPLRLTKYPAGDWSPSWSPDGRHIVFVSNRDGNGEIYVMGSDGSNPRRLTNNLVGDGSPSWSPDGRHIAFVSERDVSTYEYVYEIYVMGSDGSNLRQLTNNLAWDGSPSWSPDGRHIAFFSSRDRDLTGNNSISNIYVMELRKAGRDGTPFDDGDSPSTATSLAVGESIEGELSAGDIDYFRVTVSSPGLLVALTTGNTDTYGFIEDSSGNVLHENDDGGRGDNFLVSAVMESGIYYIRVVGRDASITGAYALGLHFDEDGSPSTATPVAVGESIEGELSAGDIDYFRVTVSSAGRLIASTTGDTDTYGFIVDSSGNVLNENDDGGERDNFLVSAAVEPDTYYIGVVGARASSTSTGAYTLTLHLGDGDSPATAIPVAVGLSIEDDLLAGDIDYFRVTMRSAGVLIASTTGNTDTHGSIEDSLGNVLNENDDGGRGDNFFVAAAVEPGTYYIRVRGADASSTGAYTLTLDLDELTPVAVGESIEGELSAGDIDYFRVTVTNAGRIVAWTTGDTDTYGSIEDSLGNVLNENDDGGERNNFLVAAVVEPGTYYIRVRGASAGVYTLTLDFDDDSSPATATPVAVGEFIEGELSAGDIDYFRVSVRSAGVLIASTTGNTDTHGSIEDSLGNVLNENDDGGERNNFLVAAVVEPGTYYIRVRGAHAYRTGAYTLTLDLDDDGIPSLATPVAVGESIEGELLVGDIDYFRVTMRSAGVLIASTTGNTDTHGSIEDSLGNVLNENDDGGERNNFLVAAVVEPGTYYIRVRGAHAYRTGAYTLTLDLDDDSSPATATPVAVGESIEGELLAGDIDYFRVTVTNAGRIVAWTTGDTDTYGSIEDSLGNVLNENDDGGRGDNFRVAAVVEPGTYYIRVRGADASSAGPYMLTLHFDKG